MMTHLLVGGGVAVVSALGIGVCLRDMYRTARTNSAQRKPEGLDYSPALDAIATASFEQTCHTEAVVGEASGAVCETGGTMVSHVVEGISHLLNH
jgi:creatinine amidohydrolase/Fe(II)-dependent formamide hydrolase-like protein